MHSVLTDKDGKPILTKSGRRVVTFDPYNPTLPCNRCDDFNAPTTMFTRTKNYQDFEEFLCEACIAKKVNSDRQAAIDARPFSKYNMDLFWKTGGKRQLIKLFLIAAAMLCLYATIVHFEHKTVDETWWWQPGTAAYERVNSWQGEPCDYETDPNCEVS